MNFLARIGNMFSRIPTPIWVVVMGPLVAIAGSEIQKGLDTREALGNKVVKRSLRSDLFLMNVLGAD
jgi:hypothetical protein